MLTVRAPMAAGAAAGAAAAAAAATAAAAPAATAAADLITGLMPTVHGVPLALAASLSRLPK